MREQTSKGGEQEAIGVFERLQKIISKTETKREVEGDEAGLYCPKSSDNYSMSIMSGLFLEEYKSGRN